MQPGGCQQRLCEDFVVERRQMLVDVRVGGHVMEVESFPVPGNAFDEDESEMWGGAVGGNEIPLVGSAGGAGWAVGQLGVAGFAADVQYGRGGMEGGEQGDGRGPRFFSGFVPPTPRPRAQPSDDAQAEADAAQEAARVAHEAGGGKRAAELATAAARARLTADREMRNAEEEMWWPEDIEMGWDG